MSLPASLSNEKNNRALEDIGQPKDKDAVLNLLNRFPESWQTQEVFDSLVNLEVVSKFEEIIIEFLKLHEQSDPSQLISLLNKDLNAFLPLNRGYVELKKRGLLDNYILNALFNSNDAIALATGIIYLNEVKLLNPQNLTAFIEAQSDIPGPCTESLGFLKDNGLLNQENFNFMFGSGIKYTYTGSSPVSLSRSIKGLYQSDPSLLTEENRQKLIEAEEKNKEGSEIAMRAIIRIANIQKTIDKIEKDKKKIPYLIPALLVPAIVGIGIGVFLAGFGPIVAAAIVMTCGLVYLGFSWHRARKLNNHLAQKREGLEEQQGELQHAVETGTSKADETRLAIVQGQIGPVKFTGMLSRREETTANDSEPSVAITPETDKDKDEKPPTPRVVG